MWCDVRGARPRRGLSGRSLTYTQRAGPSPVRAVALDASATAIIDDLATVGRVAKSVRPVVVLADEPCPEHGRTLRQRGQAPPRDPMADEAGAVVTRAIQIGAFGSPRVDDKEVERSQLMARHCGFDQRPLVLVLVFAVVLDDQMLLSPRLFQVGG